MEEIKKRPVNTTITRNTAEFSQMTGNIYETIVLLTKRANQIAILEKKEMEEKIKEFAMKNEVEGKSYESPERVALVRKYEMMPKPTLIATEEYLEHELEYRNPVREDSTNIRMEALENEVIRDKKQQ